MTRVGNEGNPGSPGNESSGGLHTILSTDHEDSFATDTLSNGDILQWVTANSRWEGIAPAVGVAHNLLSATHSDTLTASAVRGDLVIGNSTPAWSRLAIGASGRVLRSDGTDPSWAVLAHADLGSVTANQHHNQSHSSTDHTDDYVLTAGDTMTGALAITLAGVGLAVTQDAYVGGYLRVGSASAPTNITAGDLTCARLLIGSDAAFGSSQLSLWNATVTATSGTINTNQFEVAATPASNSTAQIRVASFTTILNAAAGVTQNEIRGFNSTTTHRQTGAVTTIRGANFGGLLYDSSSPATPGTVTSVYALSMFPFFDASSGAATGAVTNMTGVRVEALSAGLTITTYRGFHQNAVTLSSSTTLIGIDIESSTTASTTNVGARVAFPGIANGIGATTDAVAIQIPTLSRTMGNQTATTTNAFGVGLGIATYTSTTNVRTLTNCATLYIAGAPVASTNITVTNGPFAFWIDGGNFRCDGAILSNDGAQTICGTTGNLASANGANFGPAVPVTITVVNGIVTAVT